ncbi:hypothetical protein [Microbacterium sp. NPDC080220]|uniref:hypothetical protein n=1 Tax=Microbacterium sp. NPDC080220 TaxID=3161017 RepID=UPI00343C36A3
MAQLTYRQAAKKAGRAVITIKRWRRHGMPMGWAIINGQSVRVVEERVLMKQLRESLKANPAHQKHMAALRAREEAAQDATRRENTGIPTPPR